MHSDYCKILLQNTFPARRNNKCIHKAESIRINTHQKRLLHSYGNTAIAMGKSIKSNDQTVADATTGEFERLKEFGIKARTHGEQVTFTFKGVSKTVAKNAAEIRSIYSQ